MIPSLPKYVVKHKETWIVFDPEKDYFRYCNSGKYISHQIIYTLIIYVIGLFSLGSFGIVLEWLKAELSVEINNNKDI